MNRKTATSALVIFFCAIGNLNAWSEHSIFMHSALSGMKEIAGAAPVAAETLDSFLAKESKGLAQLLSEEEAWARANIEGYPARPDDIAFDRSAETNLRKRFLYALRVNPEAKMAMAVQLMPGQQTTGRTFLTPRDVSVYKNPIWLAKIRFAQIRPGERVAPLEILSTAADEPDLGLDIGLFEDSGTEWGSKMGFGKIPFGNANLEYSSQAPFHMTFYHEAGIVYMLAGFLKHTYPEVRVRQFYALSRYAFRTGHPYWGYRFMGMGLHYVTDLTQPYHARVLPGIGVLRMLWINLMDIAGRHQPKIDAIQLVSNRHSAIENFYQVILHRDSVAHDMNHPYWKATVGESKDLSYGKFGRRYLKDVVTQESESRADALDSKLTELIPSNLVSDPSVEFAVANAGKDLTKVMEKEKPGSVDQLSLVLADFAASFGSHSRNFIRAVLAPEDAYAPSSAK